MLQKRELPFDNDGSEYNALLKTNVVLKNGKEVSLITFVPKGLSFDDAMAGVTHGVSLSCRAVSAQTDIYSLADGDIRLFGTSEKRYFKK